MGLPASLEVYLAEKLQLQIQSSHALGGGCIHHAHRLDTDRGIFFVKYNQLDQVANFRAEAAGLSLLQLVNALPVPSPTFIGQSTEYAFLVLPFILPGRQNPRYWADFGAGLARLHLHTAPQFGLDTDNYIGALPQENARHSDWQSFYVHCRIEPMLRMARERDYINSRLSTDVENMLIKREDFFPQEAPSLLHGDLWGGNILTGPQGRAWLIDPAVYYGHREMELAFMTLFDQQPPHFYAAYEAVFPLTPGYRERFAYQLLYPLLVHVNLFGRSYLSGVQAILKRFG